MSATNVSIVVITICALLIRLVPIDFPAFSTDEARVAYRGHTLATMGKDELGRPTPILFNSLTDYQLPTVSYFTALGVLLFGKSDIGVRIPFILFGVGLVFLIYKIAQTFSPKKEFWVLCAIIIAFSPGLVFLSKIPNESILLTFNFALLFYILTRNKINLIFVFAVIVLLLFTSKFAWFVVSPFVLFTLIFYQENLSKRFKINFFILCLLLSTVTISFFLQVPQSKRSLSENNFPIFSDLTIKNGIDKLRGQGLEAGWPSSLERLLFNKSYYLTVGFFHWLSHFQPTLYFGQLDSKGEHGFISMGAWPKLVIIPFGIGLIILIKMGNRKFTLLPAFLFILTYPLIFVYPDYRQDLIVTSLPFMVPVIALGLINTDYLMRIVLIGLIILEVGINLIYLDSDIKNTNNLRPFWVKSIVTDGFNLSQKSKVAFSDDITSDIVPFIGWYTQLPPQSGFLNIPFPYKFRQTQVAKEMKIVGSNDSFYKCGFDQPTYIFASRRDLEKIQRMEEIEIDKSYKDSLGADVAFLLPPTICVK